MLPMTLALMFGENLCGMANVPVPEILKTMQEYRMNVIMAFWIVNMLASSMTNTGAFEVTYNGHLIFSKLTTGRAPTLPEIITKLNVLGLRATTTGGASSTFSLPTQ